MRKIIVSLTVSVIACSCGGHGDYTEYVDPFIGTDATGHTYPGATAPFGMVQAGPDTGTTEWMRCSGYHSSDNTIVGFSQTHLSGTGASDMGDIMLMPIVGDAKFNVGDPQNTDSGYRSHFRHETEKAAPGYYSVRLDDYGIDVEITATQRCAFYQFSYPSHKSSGIIIDLEHGIGDVAIACNVALEGKSAISGYRRSRGFVNDHTFWFYAEFSEPIKGTENYVAGQTVGNEADSLSKMYLNFGDAKTVSVKIGLSTVSAEAAKKNLLKEIPHFDFNKTRTEIASSWNKVLSLIEIEPVNSYENTIFYTAMYHSFLSPNLVSDIDGRYRGWNKKEYTSSSGDMFTNFSLWDTYRAVHPFYSLLMPNKNVEFINSFLERYRQIGSLPINEYGSRETYCMIGYHAVPVIAEAILLDRDGFDYELAFQAMKDIAMDDDRGVGLMKKYGFIPSELENNSVSKVLEYAYDDWCIAQVAKKLGKQDEHKYFLGRALNYRNHLDPETHFMRGRHADGKWVTPFDPRAVSVLGKGDFTEGNSWQYSFYVPHDMTTFIGLMGGDKLFTDRLYTQFTTEPGVDNEHAVDVTGLIGQYAQGNEPSHHAAYLFNFSGEPWKTQEMVTRIKKELYTTGRAGLCGNDDCGQMSCWYIFSAIGFYPVTPASENYIIGSPSYKHVRMNLPSGKVFEITAENMSDTNFYIQKAELNGHPLKRSYLTYDEIMSGGTLIFYMGPKPSNDWGVSIEDRPYSVAE